jgi:TolA-binding protein
MYDKNRFDDEHIIKSVVSGGAPGGALGPVDELTQRRLVERIVDSSFDEDTDTGFQAYRRGQKIAAALCVAAAAMAALGLYLLLAPSPNKTPSSPAVIAKQREVLPTSTSESRTAEPESQRQPERNKTVQSVAEGVQLLVDKDARLEIDRDRSSVALRLRKGTIWVDVNPARKTAQRPVQVLTSRGTVRVKGTVFSVEESKSHTEVTVLEGTVQIRPTRGAPTTVGKGETVRVGEAGIQSQTIQRQRLAWQTLFDHGVAKARASRALSNLATAGLTAPNPEPTVQKVKTPRITLDKQVISRPVRIITPEQLLKAARHHQNKLNYKSASRSLETLIRRFPKSEEASIALVTLGTIALDKLSRPRDALHHFNTYLSDSHRFSLRAEALYGRARALRAVGDHGEACRTLARFVQQYRRGPLAKQARRLLKSLQVEQYGQRRCVE